jgi:hypothetical protein
MRDIEAKVKAKAEAECGSENEEILCYSLF